MITSSTSMARPQTSSQHWLLVGAALASGVSCGAHPELPRDAGRDLAKTPHEARRANAPKAAATPEQKSGAVPSFSCLELQPFGEVPEAAIASVREAITSTYRVEVKVRDAVPLPRTAWYAPRKRYRAEKLLVTLESGKSTDCEKVLGLTTNDISTTKGKYEDWGILGYADMPGTAAVISTFRTKKKVAHVPPSERLARVAIHEVGHTLGLPHCPTAGCFLSDAGGTVETIDHETTLCARCRKRLRWRGEPPAQRTAEGLAP